MPRRTPNAIAVTRQRRGLKQKQLARAARIDVPRVSQLEAGYMLPTKRELAAITTKLGVAERALYGPKALALIREEEE